VIVNVALAVFAVAYVAVLMTFLNALRGYHDNGWGMAAVVSLIFVTKMSDTGAYAFGRLFGRHKMAPVLSPKKTIEGGIGGLVTAWFCSWLFFATLLPHLAGADAPVPPLWACLVYGTVVAIAGAVGDQVLFEQVHQKIQLVLRAFPVFAGQAVQGQLPDA